MDNSKIIIDRIDAEDFLSMLSDLSKTMEDDIIRYGIHQVIKNVMEDFRFMCKM